MKNAFSLSYIFLTFTIFSSYSALSQDQSRTITVTGNAEYHLSPDEIVIKIDIQEYFLNNIEKPGNKVVIESIQEEVRKAILDSGIKADKLTEGAARMVTPYNNKVSQKQRLNKTLYVCVENVDQYIELIRSLENAELFGEIITGFNITEYRSSEKEAFLTKSRSAAYADAAEKATLILSVSKEKLGKVLKIQEVRSNSKTSAGEYAFDSAAGAESGFQSITISYSVEVQFEIE
jgi:uncharacterized protein YggE